MSQFIVLPKDLKVRESLRIKLLPNGPPVPYPVQFRVVGIDPLVLRERADEVKAVLRANPNTRGTKDNWNESVKVLRLEVDQSEARALGMIQRNSVILIDQIEQDRAAGIAAWDAIVESAVRRLRPIVLTAAAAALAMIPLSRSVFWGPMAVAIMGGLIVATVLTLLALPAMYAAWFRVKRETPAFQ